MPCLQEVYWRSVHAQRAGEEITSSSTVVRACPCGRALSRSAPPRLTQTSQ